VLASLPTGSGKSWVIAGLVEYYYPQRICVISHVREILQQNMEKLKLSFPEAECAYWCAGLKEKKMAPVMFASIQSIYKEDITFDVVIADEAHLIQHGQDGMYRTFFEKQANAKIIGVTATPYRTVGGALHKGEGALFDDLVYFARTDRLVNEGWLSPIKAYRGDCEADLTNVHTRAGEFKLDEMAEAFDQEDLIKESVTDMLAKTQDRKSVLIFCCTVDHCKHVQAHIPDSVVITGMTPKDERDDILARFKAGAIRYLINCQVLTTGFDAPGIDCIVMFRATQSPGLYVQIVGRGLRKAEGKESCMYLDYGGNVRRHGTVDSISPDTGEYKRKGEAKTKTCPDCKLEIPSGKRKCECGHVFESESDRKLNINTQADTECPVGMRINTYKVRRVHYRMHEKNGIKSMRVVYECGETLLSTMAISSWICFEHEGFARQKAETWSYRHGVHPCPDTVQSALQCVWLEPTHIVVDESNKYPSVIKELFNELPENP